MSYVDFLRCRRCGMEYQLDEVEFVCEKCGGPLDIFYLYEVVADKIGNGKETLKRRKGGVWKYLELLPLKHKRHMISLGEGGTKLLKCDKLGEKLGVGNLYVKDETTNPTGSFKDRTTCVSISKALEFGIKTVAMSSSGNAGASLAAYSAKAGIECYVFVPEKIPEVKLSQMLIFGAKVVTVEGMIDDATRLMFEACKENGWTSLDTTTKVNPYSLEGAKTISYEICEQLDWKSPQWVIVPVGSGNLFSATWKGFREFHEMGLIDDLPAMVMIQSDACYPLVKAYREKQKAEEIEPWEGEIKTIALAERYPWEAHLSLKAIYESDGVAETVSDEEILAAEKLLASNEGVFAEPTGAASVAGLIKLVKAGVIEKDDVVVCEVTGSGLKDPLSALRACKAPINVSASTSMEELNKMLENF